MKGSILNASPHVSSAECIVQEIGRLETELALDASMKTISRLGRLVVIAIIHQNTNVYVSVIISLVLIPMFLALLAMIM